MYFQYAVARGCSSSLGGTHLRVVEVRQTLGSEALRQLALDDDVLHLVAQKLVVYVPRHGGLIHGKGL